MASSECAYERARLANIERNERMLRELNLGALKRDMRREERQRAERRRGAAQRREKKRKRKAAAQPQRRSRRARRLPPPKYTPDNAVEDAREEEQRREEEVANGWRDAETGLWRGERFGEVPGVPVGTVFGEGDYQRKGALKCHALASSGRSSHLSGSTITQRRFSLLLLNNDNGLSDVSRYGIIEYAGAGGRHRGQNRTAEQSFHQTWKSATNAAPTEPCLWTARARHSGP